MIPISDKQGVTLGRWIAWEVQAATEGTIELDSIEDTLRFAAAIEPYVTLTKEIKDRQRASNVQLVFEVAKKFLDDLEQSVGSEQSRLRVIEREGEGWQEYLSEGESKAAAERRMKESIDRDVEEASLLREVWQAARDFLHGRPRGS